MKVLVISGLAISGAVVAHGQGFPVTPATPTDFETRNVGDSNSGVGIVNERPVPKKVRISYTVVSPLREWRNEKGVPIRGSLIAFEEGDYSQSQRELTIVSGGKVRLLVEGKNNFNLVALTSLSQVDQEYIAGLVKARKEAAAAAAAAKK